MSCTISSGDMPIEIEWKKDGETFDPPTDIQVNPLPPAAASIVLPTDSIVLPALRSSGSHYPRLPPGAEQRLQQQHPLLLPPRLPQRLLHLHRHQQGGRRQLHRPADCERCLFFICSPRRRVLMGFPAVSPKWELEPQDLTILHKVQFTHSQIHMKTPDKYNII